ncbi:Gfo/Idh/MocA family protein [Zunongwangia endophytica]|uniref:Gfo/Idh/MocA family protein n=1 Tax=Zunongwangia endophytica TaxID=1808945 RepID=A0ABV8HBU8_9FLAO|nr:Gfo/Idh/MocA family oxidoreductase [Zunongwangia endophytica]MDN3594847.1 Gfo/Idh/MocA family oxidoreductase [Zunongwangia endophytica]
MRQKAIEIISIGGGGIVKDAHLPAYKIAGYKVKGIFDIDITKAQKLAEEFEISTVYESVTDAIKDFDDRSIFDLAVPGKEILGILEQIPNNSVILIQKPMGEDLKMAKKILELCRRKNLKAGINFQLRYAPYISKARALINDGKLGEIHDIEINVNVFTPWHLWDFLKSLPRMEILYHSIHYIDLVRSFMGDPKKVYAKSIKHPESKELAQVRSSIIMDYGAYKRANILTNHNHGYAQKYQRSFIKIEGTRGAVRIEIGVLKNYPNGSKDRFEYILFDKHKDWQDEPVEGTWFPHAFIGSMQEMITARQILEYIPDNSVQDCIHTMAAVEAAYISSKEGGINPSLLEV